MDYLKTSFVLVGVVVAVATIFTVLDIRKTRREAEDELR